MERKIETVLQRSGRAVAAALNHWNMEVKMFGIQDWPEGQREQFGQNFHLSQRKLHTLDMFSRPSLVQLLDSIPKRNIQCYTMNPNAAAIDSLTAVNADACNGEKILITAENGLFWFNIKQLENHDQEFAKLLASMFKEYYSTSLVVNLDEAGCIVKSAEMSTPQFMS
ncbi:MAG: hypothetical protein ACI9UN_000551 [Granulosicoccus sp.]